MNSASIRMEVPFVDLKFQYNSIKDEILEAINLVLDSGHFVNGEYVEKFEEEFARFVGAEYAVGVGSGTSALQLALQAADICVGHEVIVPANSFFATAEAVSNVGAVPVFADVNPQNFHLEPSSVERRITRKTRAIIPVHLYGYAMDLTTIKDLCALHNLAIIEDAAQAHGTTRNGEKVGGSGRLTCFSFYPGKNLGAYGDAGAVTCNDYYLAQKIRLLRDHGSPMKYRHSIIGTNSRLDAIQAAVLSTKLHHLDRWNQMRVCKAKRYAEALGSSGVCCPMIPSDGQHNFHLFVICIAHREVVRNYLEQFGIGTGIHYPVPLHLTDAYQNLGYPKRGSLPVAEALAEEVLSLPMYPELSEEQLEYVVQTLLKLSPETLMCRSRCLTLTKDREFVSGPALPQAVKQT